MIQEKYATETPKKEEKSRAESWLFHAGLFVLGLFAGVVISCAVLIGTAGAEGDIEYECWAMCQPGDYVNIRRSPDRHSEACGWAETGMRFRTDWEERNGFVHLLGVTEYGEGWISAGYVVYEEPRILDTETAITGRGRVASRKHIGGDRKKWLKPGDTVTVFSAADGWAVTDRGWIRTEYLEGF